MSAETCMPPLWANALSPTNGIPGAGAMLAISPTDFDSGVRPRRSTAPTSTPSLSARFGMTVQRFAFPHLSPMPLTVPWTMVHPASTAASVHAVARSESL